MIHIVTFLVALAGFVLLLLAMGRHQQDWLRRKLSQTQSRALRLTGFAALTLAFVIAGTGFGWGYGAVAWSGWLTMAAALTVAANTNRERIVRKMRP